MSDPHDRPGQPVPSRYIVLTLAIGTLWFTTGFLPWEPPLVVGVLIECVFGMAFFVAMSLGMLDLKEDRKKPDPSERPPGVS